MPRATPPSPHVSSQEFDKHSARLFVVLGLFGVWHLARVHHEFKSDIISALILGEIAHHNIAALVRAGGIEVDGGLERLGIPGVRDHLLPCNAHSIAMACDIPRETVRRKIAALIKRGWLERSPKGELFVTAIPSQHFRQFNIDLTDRILETAHQIRAILDSGA